MTKPFWTFAFVALVGAILIAGALAPSFRDLTVTGISVLGVVFCILVWLYRRTDLQLQKERAKARMYLGQIDVANTALEDSIAEGARLSQESQEFVQSAIDGVPDPTIIVGTEHHISMMNKAARKAFRMKGDPDGPNYCYRAMHGRSAPCDDSDHPCTLLSGKAYRKYEGRMNESGECRQLEIRSTPMLDSDGVVTGAIEVMHILDEHEQKTLQLRHDKERAEAASEVQSEFVAMISHEVRTPMNAVLGMTDLLRLTDLTRKQQGYIQTIQSSGNMLLGLVDNILDFRRLGAGALVLQKSEFNVVELLEQVLEITGHHAYSKGLELGGLLEGDMRLRVRGDRNRLRQILVNLVSNAVTFSDEGEIIVHAGVVTGNDAGTRLFFTVSDQGIGMSDAVMQDLFTPFATVDDAAARKQQGSGLGLTICKQLVEFMGGEIGVDSSPGAGTRIRFMVPVDLSPASGPDMALEIPALNGQRVLSVCRSPAIVDIVCSYTKAWGMNCDTASDTIDALERLREESRRGRAYGLLIVDDDDGSRLGLELAHRIRQIQDISALPIVLLRPISQPLKPGEISSIGNIFCVNKPVLQSELRLALFKITGTSALRRSGDTTVDRDDVELEDIRILVAEDNQVNRRVLTGMLNSFGHSAVCVADGLSVLTALEQTAYDIVLMDCQMPGMNGEQVTEMIRGDEQRFPLQPVIVAITADASVEHRSACLRAGMDDFIAKPLRLKRLRRGLNRWKAMVATRRSDSGAGNRLLLERLHDRASGQSSTFLNAYIDLFLRDTSARLESLVDAFDRNDLYALERESHALKGACLEFGVERMSTYCDELRQSAAEDKGRQVPELLSNLRQEFDRIRPVFEAERNERH